MFTVCYNLGFNESKTEVLVFSPDGRKDHGLHLLSVAPFEQSVVTNLGLRLDAALKVDLQNKRRNQVELFQLRPLARIKSALLKPNLGIVTHAFVFFQAELLQLLIPWVV